MITAANRGLANAELHSWGSSRDRFPRSVLSGWPFVWIMTQPLARHSKHLLADWLINSCSTSTPTIHCVVCSQTESTRSQSCQVCTKSLWQTDVCNNVMSCCNQGCYWRLFKMLKNKCGAGYLVQVNKGDVFAPFLKEYFVHIYLNTKELLHQQSQQLLQVPRTLGPSKLYSLILSPRLGIIGNQFNSTTLTRLKDS